MSGERDQNRPLDTLETVPPCHAPVTVPAAPSAAIAAPIRARVPAGLLSASLSMLLALVTNMSPSAEKKAQDYPMGLQKDSPAGMILSSSSWTVKYFHLSSIIEHVFQLL